jgi:Putative S-adenosyl-L-methionine-dependent methyltransferase
MNRVVEAELLDSLPAENARAVRSRADLRRLNFLMQHARLMAREWSRMGIPAQVESVVELGAGDGTFCLTLLRRITPLCRVSEVTLVDRQPIVSVETRGALATIAGRVKIARADVFEWLESAPPTTVIIANLFLHHFEERELRHLLALASQRTQFFIACEPRRAGWSLFNSQLLGLIGCNDVTRHDAVVSVRAGFAGEELTRLWPATGGWEAREGSAGLFSHGFTARRQHNHSPA